VESMWEGVMLSILAGLATGSCLWPMKVIKRLQFEHYWFAGMIPFLVLPWLVVAIAIPDPWSAFLEIGWRPLLIANALSIGWGIANILGGLCVVRIGLALTGAIVTGFGVTVAVTVPLVLKGTGLFSNSPDLFSTPGMIVIGAVILMLGGVAFAAVAGFGRERSLQKISLTKTMPTGSFLTGLIMAALAGVLSAGPALAFVYGNGPIAAAMKSHGAGSVAADLSVWACGFLGGALVNLLYPACLMTRRHSWNLLAQHPGEALIATLIGSQLIVGFGLQGLGMVALGPLGASVGSGIQQIMQIAGAQSIGFISGEWHGIVGRPLRFMFAAVGMLLLATLVLAYANSAT